MKTAELVFIGVAWPYVNGDIHPGHIAGNFLPADIFARFHRFLGNEVLMVSGSDCYGTPITIEADKRGKTPEQIVAEYHPNHLELFKQYGIFFDLYTQTTTKNHNETTQELLLNLARNGYLLKKKTKQYFSPDENKFLPDRYVEGTCSFCGYSEARGDQCDQCGRVLDFSELKNPVSKTTRKQVTLKETEHLFLDWPKLQDFLESYVKRHRRDWKEWIYNEAEGWLKKGLKPRAITRDINWGIEIPNSELPRELQLENAESKRIYVWFEAVIGYLSAAKEWGQNWQDYWFPKDKETVTMYNFMGKDNVVFHALFWPGQIFGSYHSEVKLPDVISANQFLNLEGKKFSKSRGVTIDSIYLAKTYGTDPVRFYLTYIMPENNDADFAWGDFVEVTNSILIGKIGNFINRVLTLGKKAEGQFPVQISEAVFETIVEKLEQGKKLLSECRFKEFAQVVIDLAVFGNVYVDQHKPWMVDKTSPEYKQQMDDCLALVLGLLVLLKPLLPGTTEALEKLIGVKFATWPELNLELFTQKVASIKIGEVKPLFVKLDPEIAEVEKQKIKA